MSWKKGRKWWRFGVVLAGLLFYLMGNLRDWFFHTDNLFSICTGILILLYIPDFFRREVNGRKGNIIIGIYVLLFISSLGVSFVMKNRYSTCEIFMPIYGEYMVTSGKKDMVLISTRDMKIYSKGSGVFRYKSRIDEPCYIYLMKKGTGTEKNVIQLLQRWYGPQVEIEGISVKRSGELIGLCYIEECGSYDKVILDYFERRPLPGL